MYSMSNKKHVHTPLLREYRKRRGISQQALAKELGIALRTYQNYERGERAIPSTLLYTLSSVGVNIHWLLTGHGEMYNPLQVVVAKITAMLKQQEATEQLLIANLDRVRTEVAARFGEGVAVEIFDSLMMPEEIPSIDEGK